MNETPKRLQPGRLATTCFVPALVRAGATGPVPRAERFGAVLLFVDAAGFSRLTAGLVADDRRGAVEVGRIVNAHFGRLIDRVAAHGGTVQAIAGDALIALWPFAKDGAGAVVRAKACGAEILAAAGNLADRQLPVRAVVDAGEVWLGRLGDDDERLAVAAGPLVERMGELSALWHEGRVVATEAARLLAEGGAEAETSGPDQAQDASDPGAYVPTLVRDLLSAAQPEWLSEFRAVSVLFARFDGWSSGAPGALERLERLAAGCRAALVRHDGRLLQFMVDDKGLILLAAWGLPGNTTEEDAARAVRAAEEVLAHAEAEGLGAGIGVTTGRAFTGVVGGAAFCHYTIVGTVVNDAAFLMRQSPGVTCDAATEAAAAAIHRFEPLGPVRFKGAASPEEVFVPRGPRTRAESDRAALVGRAAERARIDAALARPEGGVVWISGEPGIGKSHLADAIRRDLGARDVPCLSAVAESLEARLPYAALRPLFDRLLGADVVTAAALSKDRRLGAVPDLAGRLPLLADLFGFEAEETAFVAALQAAARPTETRRILADLFAALAPEGRFALFVEDVHWLETSSWLLLALLRRQVPRMAIVLTSRRIAPESLPEEAAAFLSDPGVIAAPLQRLGEVEAERLVHQTLAAESVPQEVTRRIFARAEGHPYYTKALAISMLQRGLLRSRDGHCYLASEVRSLSEVAFPDTIQGAIAARVSALGPAAQLTLKVASVAGRVFDLAQVEAIHPDAPDVATVEAHLADAAALELVEPGPSAGLLQFHHALARDTVYDLLVEE